MNTISIYELKKISSPIIIDIRDNYSYSISHVKNAINIPYYNLLNNYSHYLNKNKRQDGFVVTANSGAKFDDVDLQDDFADYDGMNY